MTRKSCAEGMRNAILRNHRKLIVFYNDKYHSYAESRCFHVLKVGKNKKNIEIRRVSLFEQNFVKLMISLRLKSGTSI